MKYRKKPVVIEAHIYEGSIESAEKIIEWTNKGAWLSVDQKGPSLDKLYINTLEGVITAQKGDYVIKGIKGEFYPCKPYIFEQTYEKAE